MESHKNYINPADDGWVLQDSAKNIWTRTTKDGIEYLGASSGGEITPEQMQAYYDRLIVLEARIDEGDEEAGKELESVKKRIEYKERYGLWA